MTSRRGLSLLAAALLLAAFAASAGCGSAGSRLSYRVTQSGRTIGSQSVTILRGRGTTTYTSVEHRPFMEYDTTTARTLRASGVHYRVDSYYSSRRVPGGSYRDWLTRSNDGYAFFADDMQTFDYVPDLRAEGEVMPFEPDSACLAQALADRFFSSGLDKAVALAVVPSLSGSVRELLVERTASGLRVTGPGIPALSLKFNSRRVLESMSGGGIGITRGPAGPLSSKPYEPEAGAREVKEVKVPVGEKLPGGGELELSGSLYLPRAPGPYRAVVLAGDAGPQDRTGGGVLAQFASELAGRGMAVLTCDRRGVPDSAGSYPAYTRDTAVRDLNAQIDYLSLRGDVDTGHISVLGYGEGGQVAAAVASGNPYVSALVLAATPSCRLWPDLVLAQSQLALESGRMQPVEAQSVSLNARNQSAILSQTNEPYAVVGGHKVFLGWMRSQASADPLAAVRALKVPLLVVQGGRDEVVPAGQAGDIIGALKAGESAAGEIAYFAELGHGLGPEPSEAAELPYRRHPAVSRQVLDRVAGWLAGK